MFDLFIPFILGLALGVDPNGATPSDLAQTDVDVAQGSGDDLDASRTPEPQVPTGKFTTATEVRPILGMTQSSWVGVREYEGQDLVYFTHLMAWRCGLWDIRYGLNEEEPERVVAMEPCNDDYAQPNVMIDIENHPPYVAHPPQSVQSVTIEIVYDDGLSDRITLNRSDILIP